MTLDRSLADSGDAHQIGNGQLIEIIERQERSLQWCELPDSRVQRRYELGVDTRRFHVEVVRHVHLVRAGVTLGQRGNERYALALQVPQRRRICYLPNPCSQRTLESILMEMSIDAQECLLAQVTGIFPVSHHATDDVPAQSLKARDQLFERPGFPI